MKWSDTFRQFSGKKTAALLGATLTISGLLLSRIELEAETHQKRAVVQDFKLTIISSGAWRGNFEWDGEGRGGLAGLAGYVRDRRALLHPGRSALLLLQQGSLSGAATSSEYRKRIFPGDFNLLNRLQFDAIAPDKIESRLIPELLGEGVKYNIPAVNFSAQSGDGSSRGEPPFPYLIIPKSRYNILISSLNNSELESLERVEKLQQLLTEQQSCELHVILLQADSNTEKQNHGEPQLLPASLVNFKNKENFVSDSFFGAGRQMASAEAPDAESILNRLVNPNSTESENQLNQVERGKQSALVIFQESAASSKFYRSGNGAYICSYRPGEICEIEFIFRGRESRSVTQRFTRINSRNFPGEWVKPDRGVVELLQQSE